jgi:hypothetical protein
LIIAKIQNKKNYLKFMITLLLPILGIYYRFKEMIENKYF